MRGFCTLAVVTHAAVNVDLLVSAAPGPRPPGAPERDCQAARGLRRNCQSGFIALLKGLSSLHYFLLLV